MPNFLKSLFGRPTTQAIRAPRHAGVYYPAKADALREKVRGLLAVAASEMESTGDNAESRAPQALILPHGHMDHCGYLAARGFALLQPGLQPEIERVIIVGPSHRVPFRGIALCSEALFATPLGNVPVDTGALDGLRDLDFVRTIDAAYDAEQSVEVQLPFLQEVLTDFAIVPILVGDVSLEEVEQVLATLWTGPKTLLIVSADLSHYQDDETARHMDEATAQAIEEFRGDDIGARQTCARFPIRALLALAAARGLDVRRLGLGNSSDGGAGREEVTGFASFAFF